MKFLLLFIVSMFLSIPSIGQNESPEIRKSFYEKGFSDIYKIDNSGIYLSRIFKFDNYSEKELRDRVSAYLNRRIERRISDEDANSDNLFKFRMLPNGKKSNALRAEILGPCGGNLKEEIFP